MEKITVRETYREFNDGGYDESYTITTHKEFHDKCRAFKKLCRQWREGVKLPRTYDERILEHSPDLFVIRDGSYEKTSFVVQRCEPEDS